MSTKTDLSADEIRLLLELIREARARGRPEEEDKLLDAAQVALTHHLALAERYEYLDKQRNEMR